jgi:hypothetical protein
MFATYVESIPCTDIGAAQDQFRQDGHVGLSGLVNPAWLEPAIEDTQELSSRLKTHNRGRETVTKLRIPDPDSEEALYAVLQAMQKGAALLGHDIMPTTGKSQLDLLETERETPHAIRRQYRSAFVGAVATINLRGQSYHWIGSQANQGVEYAVNPGEVILEDPSRRLTHRSFTGFDEGRIALVVAKQPSRAQPEATPQQ